MSGKGISHKCSSASLGNATVPRTRTDPTDRAKEENLFSEVSVKIRGKSVARVLPVFRSDRRSLVPTMGARCRASPARPTNKSQAPRVQAFARTQRTTRDKQWDGGPSRSHRPVPAHVSRDPEGTCGHAIRRS